MVFLVALGGYYFYENIVVVNKNANNEDINDIITSKDNGGPIDFKITSFDNVEIIGDEEGEGNTHMINVTGKMNLSYNEEKYNMIRISGYCLDEDNNEYDVWSSINNNEKEFTLYNTITESNSKINGDINWNNVKITYCKVDKLLALDLNDNKKEIEEKIDYEHYFE